jgi:hypothetical protein
VLNKKTRKNLKKLRVKMRVKKTQKIMQAIKIHQEISERQVQNNKDKSNKYISEKVIILKGRIAASRKRARDLWSK